MKSVARLIGLVVILLLPACASSTDGAAIRNSGAPASSPAHQEVPVAKNPRDVRPFGESPCEVFTVQQLTGFGLDQPGEQRTITAGDNEECTWVDSGSNGELRVITFPDSNILELEYGNRQGYPIFEPTEIAGLPAVVRQNSAGSFRCVVVVGLAEAQGINVSFSDITEPIEDPCGAARMAAEVAVGNLPPLG